MPPSTSLRHIQAGTCKLAVLTQGTGIPLVFLHGFPLDHSMWEASTDAFSKHWQVIAPDLRGFGESQASAGVVTMEQLADDLADLLDAMQIDQPIVLCGLSMGGYVAFEFWRKHRHRLRGLVLCDTRAMPDTAEAAQTRRDTADSLTSQGLATLANAMLPKLFASKTFSQRSHLVTNQRNVILRTSPEGAAAALRGMAIRTDFRALLHEIHVPTLVVVGQEDAISTVDEMREIATTLPDSQFVVIPDSGHMAPLENPEAFRASLEQFLSQWREK